MKRYRVSPEARNDLKRISLYIAVERESPQGNYVISCCAKCRTRRINTSFERTT